MYFFAIHTLRMQVAVYIHMFLSTAEKNVSMV